MKKNTVVLAFLLSIFLMACTEKDAINPIDLTGEWIGTGYQCPVGTLHTERVKIVHEGSNVVATKITGDSCVRAGSTTFKGSFDSKTQIGNITVNTGDSSTPSCCTAQGILVLEDTFLKATILGGETIIFKRN